MRFDLEEGSHFCIRRLRRLFGLECNIGQVPCLPRGFRYQTPKGIPHLFRDIAATTIAIEDPRNVRVASDLLGHSDPSTTERYYIQASMIEASRKHQNVVLALRYESGRALDRAEEK